MINKAVYIGAGLDIIPVLLYQDIKKFIFIDSQPQSEFGEFGFTEKKFFKNNFISTLNNIMKKNNFTLITTSNNLLVFVNKDTEQEICYYINTPFPIINQEVINELKDSTILILCGHDPHIKILEYMTPVRIICNLHTCYNNNKDCYEIPELSTTLKLYDMQNIQNIQYFLYAERTEYNFWKYEEVKPDIVKEFDKYEFNNIEEMNKKKTELYNELY